MSEVDNFNEWLADQHPELRPLVTTKVVCSMCRGEGVLHGFPGVYTSDDFESHEDIEEYLDHERTCEECGGLRVVDEPTRENNQPDTWREWEHWCREMAELAAIEAAERRFGA